MKQFLISTYVYHNGNLLSNFPFTYLVECETKNDVESKLLQNLNQDRETHTLETIIISEKIV
jgi:hypothetical protein